MRTTQSLTKNSFSPAACFGAGTDISRRGVGALYDALIQTTRNSTDNSAARRALDDWKTLLSQATGLDMDRPSKVLESLGVEYGIEPNGDSTSGNSADGDSTITPAAIPFALHTYYALLVKLILCRALRSVDDPAELARSAGDDALLGLMCKMEAGGLVSALRMPNPIHHPIRHARSDCDSSDWDPFAWYLDAWSGPMAGWLRQAAAMVARFDPRELCADGKPKPGGLDPLGGLYQALLPKTVRHALGEYYTPSWLVYHILDRLEYRGDTPGRLLDPACGSGNFLLAAIRRIRRGQESKISPENLARKITENVVGFDLNPTAVMAARANYLLAIGGLFEPDAPPNVPVHLRDTILEDDAPSHKFDYIAGNPPWIAWDNLPDEYRRRTKPIWQRYGLFTLSATAARHGGGKKDLSMLMTYVCADRHLADGGRLGFVITQTLFQTKGAGDGFRRFQIGADGPPLRVLHADDMVRLKPFPGAANWTGTIFLEKGAETAYPISYDRWRLAKGRRMPDAHADDALADDVVVGKGNAWRERFQQDRLTARPIDHGRANSPWFVQPADLQTDLTRLIGPSDYTAHLGANTGGANPVYWLKIIKTTTKTTGDGILVENLTSSGARDRKYPAVRQVIEPDLVYPLVRWGDVTRFRAVPSAHILLAQDVNTRRGHDENFLRSHYPKTLGYLERFQGLLTARAAYRRYQSRAPFYSMYNVGSYTTAPIKVVWRRMDRRINAAVLEPADDHFLGTRPIVPQETCVIIDVDTLDEAHYLAAVLNSRQTDFIVAGHSVSGGKGFGTPSMLDYLRIRKFNPNDSRHVELARLGRLAHGQAAAGADTSNAQTEIDRLANH